MDTGFLMNMKINGFMFHLLTNWHGELNETFSNR